MAGAILKTLGGLVIVVGALALLAGLGAAGFGFIDEQENQDRLLPDPDRTELNEALLLYGAIAAGAGVVLLIVGIIIAVGGGARSQAAFRRDLREAAGARDPKAPTPSAPRTRPVAALAAGGLLLAGVLVAGALWAVNGAPEGALSTPSSATDDPGADRPLGNLAFAGRVRGQVSEPLGSHAADASESQKEFDAPAGTGRLRLALDWTPAEGGTDDLRILLELQDGTGWRELGRQGGVSPVVLELAALELDGAHLRYRVFANADASVVVEQPFKVEVLFQGP